MRAERAIYKIRQISLCLIALFALSVSAVSACACTHHQEQAAAEQPSCHPSSHAEKPATEQQLSDHFDSGCSCFVNIRVPAIASKSENKKIAADNADPARAHLFMPVQPARPTSEQTGVAFDTAARIYSGFLLSSGPSRAPPRL